MKDLTESKSPSTKLFKSLKMIFFFFNNNNQNIYSFASYSVSITIHSFDCKIRLFTYRPYTMELSLSDRKASHLFWSSSLIPVKIKVMLMLEKKYLFNIRGEKSEWRKVSNYKGSERALGDHIPVNSRPTENFLKYINFTCWKNNNDDIML